MNHMLSATLSSILDRDMGETGRVPRGDIHGRTDSSEAAAHDNQPRPGQPLPGLGPAEMVVFQPTTFCNFDCRYCYLPNRSVRNLMKPGTPARTLSWLQDAGLVGDHVALSWHAGEPLAAGVSWFEDAYERLGEVGRSIDLRSSLQTNAALLDDRWIRLLVDRRIRVGVSLDGPAAINDTHRVTRTGRGTHQLTMRGIEALRANGVPFQVIAVLTVDSLDHPDAMYDCFASLGCTQVAFNVEETEGGHISTLSREGIEARLRAFMERLISRLAADDHPFVLREVQAPLRALIGYARSRMPVELLESHPFRVVNVAHDGRLSTFAPELLGQAARSYETFEFGNVWKDSPADVFSHPAFHRVASDVAGGIRACRATCPYFPICGGGSPSNKFFETGNLAVAETMACRLNTKLMVDVMRSALESGVDLRRAHREEP